MLDAIRRRKRIAQVILLLLIVPFAFFGVERYFSSGPSRTEVATVGERAISVAALQEALQRQADQLRAQMGSAFDPNVVRNPSFVEGVVWQLVERELLVNEAHRLGLRVPEAVVRQTLASIPAFQRNGRFDYDVYQQALRAQGLTPVRFEALVQEDLVIEKLVAAVRGAVVPPQSAQLLLRWQEEERHLRWQRHSIAERAATLPVDDQAVQAYFEANRDRFQKPAYAALEYVVLDPAKVAVEPISDEAVAAAFEARKTRYRQPEKRHVRHILISKSGGDQTPPQAVELLYAELQGKDENGFAEVAKARSEDPATRDRGGDLGWVTAEDLPAPLAQAVFAQPATGLLGPVASDFGWHLIWVAAIEPAKEPSLAEVAEELRAELAQEARKKRFAQLSAELADLAFDAVDRLNPVAERIGAPIEKSGLAPLASLKLNDGTPLPANVLAHLSSDRARRGENLEPITLPDGRIVVVRVTAFEPERPLTFDEAKEEAIRAWRQERAKALLTDELKQATPPHTGEVVWDGEKRIKRNDTTLPREVVDAAFALERQSGTRQVVATGDTVWLLELVDITTPALPANDPRIAPLTEQLRAFYGSAQYRAWLRTLEGRYPVRIRQEAVRALLNP